jgi:hypothetical protein
MALPRACLGPNERIHGWGRLLHDRSRASEVEVVAVWVPAVRAFDLQTTSLLKRRHRANLSCGRNKQHCTCIAPATALSTRSRLGGRSVGRAPATRPITSATALRGAIGFNIRHLADHANRRHSEDRLPPDRTPRARQPQGASASFLPTDNSGRNSSGPRQEGAACLLMRRMGICAMIGTDGSSSGGRLSRSIRHRSGGGEFDNHVQTRYKTVT